MTRVFNSYRGPMFIEREKQVLIIYVRLLIRFIKWIIIFCLHVRYISFPVYNYSYKKKNQPHTRLVDRSY